jgi:hypothetical protein
VVDLRAVRNPGLELVEVFALSGREAAEARQGAEQMVVVIDRVLEVLRAPVAP